MVTPKPAENAPNSPTRPLRGVLEPRIHSPLHPELPSKGQEMIDFCESIGWPLMDWQKWLAIEAHRYNPETNRWRYNTNILTVSRQNGKSSFLALRVLTGMFLWDEKMQVGMAHKLTTSSETFYKISEIIESTPKLQLLFAKKFESKGAQELRTTKGNRYLIRANNASARGISAVDVIHLDELREYRDPEIWSSIRYSQMSSKNPQAWMYSSAGDQHSVILNQFRDRGIAAMAGADDPIGYWEWSAPEGTPVDANDQRFWDGIAHANPSLGQTIHPDNIIASLNDDESIIKTEVMTMWVDTINPLISPIEWQKCADENKRLDPEATTWMGIDLAPDRKAGALVAAQRDPSQEGKFIVALLHTWASNTTLNDIMLANEIAEYVRKYPVDQVAYSTYTSAAVASRLKPAGIPVIAIDGADYALACDMLLSAIASGRLIHGNQPELTKQALAAVKLPKGDGGFVLGRKVSNATIAATVGIAMTTFFAGKTEGDDDIVIS